MYFFCFHSTFNDKGLIAGNNFLHFPFLIRKTPLYLYLCYVHYSVRSEGKYTILVRALIELYKYSTPCPVAIVLSEILKLVLEFSVNILFLHIFKVYPASCSVNSSFLLEEADPNP